MVGCNIAPFTLLELSVLGSLKQTALYGKLAVSPGKAHLTQDPMLFRLKEFECG